MGRVADVQPRSPLLDECAAAVSLNTIVYTLTTGLARGTGGVPSAQLATLLGVSQAEAPALLRKLYELGMVRAMLVPRGTG